MYSFRKPVRPGNLSFEFEDTVSENISIYGCPLMLPLNCRWVSDLFFTPWKFCFHLSSDCFIVTHRANALDRRALDPLLICPSAMSSIPLLTLNSFTDFGRGGFVSLSGPCTWMMSLPRVRRTLLRRLSLIPDETLT